MYNILSSNASSLFARIKSAKSTSTDRIPFLTVGEKEFFGDNVKDGFFESIKNLKLKNDQMGSQVSDWANIEIKEDYRNILDICHNKVDLPNISIQDSTTILMKMKNRVNDFYSITTLHYINAGEAGFVHFNFLLNCIINDVTSFISSLYLNKHHQFITSAKFSIAL